MCFHGFCAVIKKNGENVTFADTQTKLEIVMRSETITETGARSQGRWEQEEQEFSVILCRRGLEGAQPKSSSVSKKQK